MSGELPTRSASEAPCNGRSAGFIRVGIGGEGEVWMDPTDNSFFTCEIAGAPPSSGTVDYAKRLPQVAAATEKNGWMFTEGFNPFGPFGEGWVKSFSLNKGLMTYGPTPLDGSPAPPPIRVRDLVDDLLILKRAAVVYGLNPTEETEAALKTAAVNVGISAREIPDNILLHRA